MRIRSSIATVLALALAVAGRASGQEPTRITGRVTDAANQQPIVAVQVLVTGTSFGAASNDSGRFLIRAPADAKSLTFRRIGYVPAVVPLVAGQTDYAISLKRDVLQLERQVVTGVATTVSSKNSATNDPVITGSQLNGAPTATLENALQGKIAGVQVDQNSGAPGGGLQVQVRGVTSIFGNTQPLYVVDGVIYNNSVNMTGLNAVSGSASNQVNPVGPSDQDQSINRIADINPNDIESMQVLEGAAASSIYGNLAAAGVVLITTKKGQQGKPQVDATQKFGTFNLENSIAVKHYSLSQAYADGAGFGVDSATVLANFNACQGFCDFQKSLYGGGELSNETDVSVRGGSPTGSYFVSGQTKYDNGLQINTGYNKQTVRTSVTEHLFNTITASGNVSYTSSMTRTGVNGNDNFGIAGYDVISYTHSWFNMAAHAPPPSGGLGGYVGNPFGNANAYQDAHFIQTPDEVNHTTLGGTINWKAFTSEHQSLEFNVLGGADFTNEHVNFYAPPGLFVEQLAPAFPGVSTTNSGYARLSNYSVSIIHHLTLAGVNATTSIGLTRDKNEQYQVANVGQNCAAGLQSFYNGCTVQSPFAAHTQVNDQGYYGQEQLLLFNETLALTGGVNAERSTSDGGVNRYYPYPKVSGSYRFVSPFSGLDEFKIRGAYGQAGTLPVYGAKFNSLCSTNYNGAPSVNYCSSAQANNLGDPDIKPETNTTIETGFDATLLHSRAQFSATVFRKRITDLLLPEALPASTGATNEWINGGQVSNYGLELTLNATPIQSGQFTWTTTENYSRIYNRVDNLPVPAFVAGPAFGGPFGEFQIAQGNPITALWGVKTVGGPLVPLGNSIPAFTLGFGQDLSYGPLHAHIFFDWREGQSVSNLTENYFDANGTLADTIGSAKRLAAENAGLTPYVQKASFLKLRELSLKYDLPMGFVTKVGHGYVRYASLSLTGRNLLTWTNYQGLDPEVSNFGIQSFARAQDVTPYPPSRSYFLQIDLGF